MASNRGFGWAILGTGAVSEKFAPGLKALGARVAVAASRDPARAEAFARRHMARAASYEAAVADPEVRAVYIATPPAQHEAHARLAIDAGRAVLIEKPFAMDAAAAERIALAARQAGVFCMEAMWTRFQPLVQDIRRRIESGEIGAIRQFHGAFCGADVPDAAAALFDPARGGGALMHRGIYPLSLARHFLGPVDDLQSSGRIGETGVDEDSVITLRHASGALSSLRASLRSNGPNGMVIQGTEGTIKVEPPIFRPVIARLYNTVPRRGGTSGGGSGGGLRDSGLVHGLWQRAAPVARALRPGGRRIAAPYTGNGYGHEAAAVMAALAAGETESSVMPLDESVEIMRLIDTARSQWGAP